MEGRTKMDDLGKKKHHFRKPPNEVYLRPKWRIWRYHYVQTNPEKHAKDGNWAWGTCNNIVMYRIYISDRDFELKVPVFIVLKHMRVSGSITTANKQPRW